MSGAPGPYVDVAPTVAVSGTFTYRVPAELQGRSLVGVRAVVPFGRRPLTGLVVAHRDRPPDGLDEGRVLDLRDVLDDRPVVVPPVLDLLRWAADYYLAGLGELARAALPAGLHGRARRFAWRTPEGDAALAAGGLSDARAALLAALPGGSPGEECGALERRLGPGARVRRLLDLAGRGLAALEYRFSLPRVRVRRESRYRATGIPAPDGLTPKRSAVLQAVAAGGDPGVTRAVVVEAAGRPDDQLRWLRREGLVERFTVEVYRDPFAGDAVASDSPPVWTPDQRAALEAVDRALDAGGYHTLLLHGVTGSGKTEVYLEAIRRVAEAGRQALVLVPEIALTPQLSARFRARFGERVAVLHSGLSAGERYDQWRRIRAGELPIVVGARSAVFAPLEDVGVVVVDEEHDPSYKQDGQPRYDGRNLALVRAQQAGALALLGSATPSLESHVNARRGRYEEVVLGSRPGGGRLPEVEIVDLRRAAPPRPGPGEEESPFSPSLAEALQETVADRGQAILFLNRRGWSSFVVCQACGHPFRCDQCAVGLTHHRGPGLLRCHYCDHAERVPETCPACGDRAVRLFGLGTERLESVVRALLPEARVARLDRDTAGRRSLSSLVRAMRRGDVDVLVGTQMVTKGHDFPGVTLVGVVAADLGLNQPDFRAAERTFQLLTQVAGRAGRGDRPGRVIIQTFSPGHYALVTAKGHDYAALAERELAIRRELGYPPYGHLIALKLDSEDPERVRQAARALGRTLATALARPGAEPAAVLGPAPAPLSMLRGRHRWQLLLKARERRRVRALLREALAAHPRGFGAVRVAIDVDPIHML